MEASVGAADPAVQAAVRPAAARAHNAETDRGWARRIAEEAESRVVEEIEWALEGGGIQNKPWLEKAWDTVSTPFRSWDDLVNLARKVALVAGIAVLLIGTGGAAGAILAMVVVFADLLNKYRQGKASLGQVVLDGIGMIPGGRQMGLLASGGKAVAALGAAPRWGCSGRKVS